MYVEKIWVWTILAFIIFVSLKLYFLNARNKRLTSEVEETRNKIFQLVCSLYKRGELEYKKFSDSSSLSRTSKTILTAFYDFPSNEIVADLDELLFFCEKIGISLDVQPDTTGFYSLGSVEKCLAAGLREKWA